MAGDQKICTIEGGQQMARVRGRWVGVVRRRGDGQDQRRGR
jgi:hypothetical protein